MAEAQALTLEQSRLRVALADYASLTSECAVVESVYEAVVTVPPMPKASGSDSAAVRVQVELVQAVTTHVRTQLDGVRSHARRARLAERIASLPDLVIPNAPDRAAGLTPAESIASRAARYLDALDDGVELSEEFVQLASKLTALRGSAGDIAVLALQEEVGRLNQSSRRRTHIAMLLGELDARAGALADPGLAALVVDARFSGEAIDDAALVTLTDEIAAAEATARAERDAEHVATSMAEILAGLGYEVVSGFETVVPEGGLLVRKPGWRAHGLLVDVDAESHRIDLAVVRTEPEGDAARSETRDTEVEVEMCADLPDMLDGIGAHGIHPGNVKRRSAGVVPVAAIYEPGTVAEIRKRRTERSRVR
jgi:hypothetical protein